jgi:hypothetical protein
MALVNPGSEVISAPPVSAGGKGFIAGSVGVRGLVAWNCVRTKGQETYDGVWVALRVV